MEGDGSAITSESIIRRIPDVDFRILVFERRIDMAVVTTQEAYDQIIAYIMSHGGTNRTWYAGIAADARQSLFVDHLVPEMRTDWVYRICSSDSAARNVKSALFKLGCDGESGGGDTSSIQVYAYKKTSSTKP